MEGTLIMDSKRSSINISKQKSASWTYLGIFSEIATQPGYHFDRKYGTGKSYSTDNTLALFQIVSEDHGVWAQRNGSIKL